MPQIGEIKRSHELNIKGRTTYIYYPCVICNIAGWKQAIKENSGYKPRWIRCRSCAARNTQIKKGTMFSYISCGYKMVKTPRKYISMSNSLGYVKYSRLVMARYLSRSLTSGEIVHHKDSNTLNDDISNLQLMSNAEHCRHHHKQKNTVPVLAKSASELGKKSGGWYVEHACIECGKTRWVLLNKGEPISSKCVSCGNKHKKGNWKGGISYNRKAYNRIYRNTRKQNS